MTPVSLALGSVPRWQTQFQYLETPSSLQSLYSQAGICQKPPAFTAERNVEAKGCLNHFRDALDSLKAITNKQKKSWNNKVSLFFLLTSNIDRARCLGSTPPRQGEMGHQHGHGQSLRRGLAQAVGLHAPPCHVANSPGSVPALFSWAVGTQRGMLGRDWGKHLQNSWMLGL